MNLTVTDLHASHGRTPALFGVGLELAEDADLEALFAVGGGELELRGGGEGGEDGDEGRHDENDCKAAET